MDLPKCSVIVLNWNGKEHLDECFSSVLACNYPQEKLEVIMVDNASTDGSVEFVKANFPAVRVLALDKNYGFSVGNNRGVEISTGDYVLILNNDLKVDKDWLVELMKVMLADESIAVCGSKVMDYRNPKMIQYAGAYLDITGAPYHVGSGETDRGQYDQVKEVFYALDCSALYRRSAISKLKYFYDPTFFFNCEETDLCWRLKYLGYKVLYVPKSVVFHKGGASSSKAATLMTYYLYRNKIWMFKKNLRPPLRQILLSLVMARTFAVILYRMLLGQWKFGFKVLKHAFDKVEPGVDMSKISFRQQLVYLSPPLLGKYLQYLTKVDTYERRADQIARSEFSPATNR
jgi:hypothetical protein